jgi:hypothetical protein
MHVSQDHNLRSRFSTLDHMVTSGWVTDEEIMGEWLPRDTDGLCRFYKEHKINMNRYGWHLINAQCKYPYHVQAEEKVYWFYLHSASSFRTLAALFSKRTKLSQSQ